jgi:hypothetical protein
MVLLFDRSGKPVLVLPVDFITYAFLALSGHLSLVKTTSPERVWNFFGKFFMCAKMLSRPLGSYCFRTTFILLSTLQLGLFWRRSEWAQTQRVTFHCGYITTNVDSNRLGNMLLRFLPPDGDLSDLLSLFVTLLICTACCDRRSVFWLTLPTSNYIFSVYICGIQ